ncbi:hypothetical protein [Microbacterium sp.]|uniref:hypothetical protein n=1 Tax=Microbacterium sp. TaxID=51671 RepID=UPI003F96012C
MADDSDDTVPCECGGTLHYLYGQVQPHEHRTQSGTALRLQHRTDGHVLFGPADDADTEVLQVVLTRAAWESRDRPRTISVTVMTKRDFDG